MPPTVLDTSTLTRFFKGDPAVLSMTRQHISLYGQLYITIVTYYEVMRGFKLLETQRPNMRRLARERQRHFQEFCYVHRIMELDQLACQHAAEIYATLRRQGKYYQEGTDILIAGIALANHCAIVTENRKHFEAIAGLQVEVW